MASAEMPKYRCHKEVHALKIQDVKRHSNGDGSLVVKAPFASINKTKDWLHKHNPQPGGYLVVYKDGYESFSPAEAFEDGYTRI